MEICTTDYLRHTAQMAVVETLWQLHTLSVINSWRHTFHCVVAPTHHNVALQFFMLLALSYMMGVHGLRLLCSGMHDIVG